VNNAPNKPPNEELAAEIAAALTKANLVDAAAAKKAQIAIAEGTMKREDWRLLFDPKRTRRGRSSDNA